MITRILGWTTLALVACSLSVSVAAAASPAVTVVDAPGSPVHLEQVKVLNSEAAPMVLLYAAVNQTDAALDQFTVTVFVFDKDKRLKAQAAPDVRSYLAFQVSGLPANATVTAARLRLYAATSAAAAP